MTASRPADAGATQRKGKVKKQLRIEALRQEKERAARLREAAVKRDLLEGYSAFKRFDREGAEVELESMHGSDLSEADVDACIALQRQNLAQLSQTETWDEETARAALKHTDSRVLLLRGVVLRDGAGSAHAESAPTTTADEWVVVPSASELLARPDGSTPGVAALDATSGAAADSASARAEKTHTPEVLGYLHMQFCIGSATTPQEQPLLCVLNMQLGQPVMGKGLGKFALQFVELIARRNGFELVMLYMKDGKVTTMSLSHSKLRPSNPSAKLGPLSDARANRPPAALGGGVDDDDDDAFEIVGTPEALTPMAAHAVVVGC